MQLVLFYMEYSGVIVPHEQPPEISSAAYRLPMVNRQIRAKRISLFEVRGISKDSGLA